MNLPTPATHGPMRTPRSTRGRLEVSSDRRRAIASGCSDVAAMIGNDAGEIADLAVRIEQARLFAPGRSVAKQLHRFNMSRGPTPATCHLASTISLALGVARTVICLAWHWTRGGIAGREPHGPLEGFEIHLLDVGIVPRLREVAEVRPERPPLAVRARERDRKIGVLAMVVRVLEVEARRVEMREHAHACSREYGFSRST